MHCWRLRYFASAGGGRDSFPFLIFGTRGAMLKVWLPSSFAVALFSLSRLILAAKRRFLDLALRFCRRRAASRRMRIIWLGLRRRAVTVGVLSSTIYPLRQLPVHLAVDSEPGKEIPLAVPEPAIFVAPVSHCDSPSAVAGSGEPSETRVSSGHSSIAAFPPPELGSRTPGRRRMRRHRARLLRRARRRWTARPEFVRQRFLRAF